MSQSISNNPAELDRLYALLADRALSELDASDVQELENLLKKYPGVNPEEMDSLVTDVMLAGTAREALPLSLQARLNTDIARTGQTATPPSRLLSITGWVAVAACLLFMLYQRQGAPRRNDPVAARRELIAQANIQPLKWESTVEGAAAPGDVVWSDAKQAGFMRFASLAANDPNDWQYQLWIFDTDRDDKFPVDGGVFDVNANGETVVPIDPRVPIRKAKMFAITKERKGGVVVSDRTALIALAKV